MRTPPWPKFLAAIATMLFALFAFNATAAEGFLTYLVTLIWLDLPEKS